MTTEQERVQQVVDQVYETELQRELEDPERLRELYGAPWVDGPWRDRARAIAEIAQSMVKAEIAEVNMVTDRAMICIASAADNEREVPVENSYCQHVVATRSAVVIRDAHITRFVKDNPTSKFLRSYIGIPLTHRGRVLGALCVADKEPRAWTEIEVHLLTQLAATLLSSIDWQP